MRRIPSLLFSDKIMSLETTSWPDSEAIQPLLHIFGRRETFSPWQKGFSDNINHLQNHPDHFPDDFATSK